ncbi:hook-length control protein FliK [Methylobacterium phyllostachyos]|uniref:Hook-length control protein FliK n=1 Tax=Methylobacterium phyllostachyos TaxID=582672 RepID=A0A1H0B6R6_9HYPH|nr:flagellar hook-length control protein FliK [Methylobacterium phyllostachyos]SDN41311.1 hook-length control protein FliK [Methylobacterium phyllostachyos]
MNPISATLKQPAPQPDREVNASQPEADVQNPPQAGGRRGFADALRAASGQSASPRGGTGGSEPAASDDATGTNDSTQAVPGIPAASPAADPAGAAAAILANILNASATPAAAALPVAGADGRAGAAGAATDGPAPAGSALRIAASAPGATNGPGSVPLDDTVLGLTNAAATAVPRRDGTDPTDPSLGGQIPARQPSAGPLSAGPIPAAPPKVTVLDRAAHFKPVLPNAAPGEPALSPPPAPVSGREPAPGPAEGAGAKLQRAQTEVPALVAAAALKAPAPGPVQSPSQTVSDPAGAAVRATGAGLEKADVTALSDIRAVSGIAWTGLATDKRSGETEAADPPTPSATGLGLPAGTLPTIAAAIRDEIDRAAASEPAARASQTDPAVPAAPDGPLRVLRIQLRPDDLGTVTVELRLANGQLETHLRASQAETAALLHRDAAILTDLLKQANYQPEVTVSQARASDSGGFSGNAPSQGQPGFSDGGARPGQGGDRQRQADRSPAAGRREGERGDETIRPRDSGVYL